MPAAQLSLSAVIAPDQNALSGRVGLDLGTETVELQLTVPDGPVDFESLLPILAGITDLVVEHAARGKAVSCRAGCGACCRQLVPISQAEARALARLVDSMPEPRQSEMRTRFDAAMRTFHASGLLAEIDANREGESANTEALGIRYFRHGVPCPFLEDESCSIHAVRPLICREYLVTSPFWNCRDPSPDTIHRIGVPLKPSRALLLADSADSGVPWMPLIYALGFAATVPPEPPKRAAPELLAQVLSHLREGDVAAP